MSGAWPWPVLSDLASCLALELAESGRPDVCFLGVLPGAFVPLDYCQECSEGKCGMAWVRLSAVGEDATIDNGGNLCTRPLEVGIEVGIGRCAPMPDDDGEPPDMAAQLEAALGQVDDMNAALRAIRCCSAYVDQITLGTWAPIGPEGGCIGGRWTLTVAEV